MTNFEDEILSLITSVQMEERRRLEQEERNLMLLEESRRKGLEAERRVRLLSRQAVDILESHHVDPQPIWERKHGEMKQRGFGWHVLKRFHYPTEGIPTTTLHALSSEESLFEFRYVEYQDHKNGPNDQDFSGIIFPNKPEASRVQLEFLESKAFKMGLASLVAGNGAYIDR